MAILLPSSLSLFPSSPSQCLLSLSSIAGANASVGLSLQWRSLKLSSFPHHKKTQILTRASSEEVTVSVSSDTPPRKSRQQKKEEFKLKRKIMKVGMPEKKEEESVVSAENPPKKSRQLRLYEAMINIKTKRKIRETGRRLYRKRVLKKRGKWAHLAKALQARKDKRRSKLKKNKKLAKKKANLVRR